MTKVKDAKIGQIFIELTNLCNFNCTFCPNDKMTRPRCSMDPAMAKGLVDEIVDKKISERIAFLLMGEPLLYPKIFEILEYAAKKGVKITLSTNGLLLSPENIDRLLRIPLEILQISLQTPTAESFQMRRSNQNVTYERYIDGIKNLLRRKMQMGGATKLSILCMDTRFSLERLVLHGMPSLGMALDYAETKRVINELASAMCGSEGPSSGPVDMFAGVTNTLCFLKRTFFGAYKIKASEQVEFAFGGLHDWGNIIGDHNVIPARFGSCNALVDQFAVLCNGDYSLCCKDYNGDLVIGNAKKQSLYDVITGEQARRIRKDFMSYRLPFKRCRLCRGGKNLFELCVKTLVLSAVYSAPFILRPIKRFMTR